MLNWGLCRITACCIEACAESPRVVSIVSVIHNAKLRVGPRLWSNKLVEELFCVE